MILLVLLNFTAFVAAAMSSYVLGYQQGRKDACRDMVRGGEHLMALSKMHAQESEEAGS